MNPSVIYESAGSKASNTYCVPATLYNSGNHREPEVIHDDRIPCYIQLPVKIPCDGGVLQTKRAFVVSVWRDDGVFCADDTLGIDISEAALTYEELVASIDGTLAFLWEEYAIADDAVLNEGAVKLKQLMRKHFFVA